MTPNVHLANVVELSLWVGQLLMQFSAESEVVESSVHRLGTALGADWMDVTLTSNGIIVSASAHGEFRTRSRCVIDKGVDMAKILTIDSLITEVHEKHLTISETKHRIIQISKQGSCYPEWVKPIMVGAACGAFCRMFGADVFTSLLTVLATTVAMFIRHYFLKRHYNLLLVVVITAFSASVILSVARKLPLDFDLALAQSAAVLCLVPGVPLINAVTDLIKGHVTIGLAKGVKATMITIAIAVGLMISFAFAGLGG